MELLILLVFGLVWFIILSLFLGYRVGLQDKRIKDLEDELNLVVGRTQMLTGKVFNYD